MPNAVNRINKKSK